MTQKHFKDYDEAFSAAEEYGKLVRHDIGLEKASDYDPGYVIFILPWPENRYGHELRCEVVPFYG